MEMKKQNQVGSNGIKFLLFLILVSSYQLQAASCTSSISGLIVIENPTCYSVNPNRFFSSLDKVDFSWIKDLDPVQKKKFYRSYDGVVIKGKVVSSQAVQKGLETKKGVLKNQNVRIFYPRKKCPKIKTSNVALQLREVCCQGGGESPCLLGSGLYATKVFDAANVKIKSTKNINRRKRSNSPSVLKAKKYYKQRKWDLAAKSYMRAYKQSEASVVDIYNMGLSFRRAEKCSKVFKPLSELYDKMIDDKLWVGEEKVARKASFLLARCYAKELKSAESVQILSGYLLESKKYRSEILRSLKHSDFRPIKLSNEFQEYKKAAESSLRKNPAYVPVH